MRADLFKKAIGTDGNGRLICYDCGKHGKITIKDRRPPLAWPEKVMIVETKDADELTAIFDKKDNHIGYMHESCKNVVDDKCQHKGAFLVPLHGDYYLCCMNCGVLDGVVVAGRHRK